VIRFGDPGLDGRIQYKERDRALQGSFDISFCASAIKHGVVYLSIESFSAFDSTSKFILCTMDDGGGFGMDG